MFVVYRSKFGQCYNNILSLNCCELFSNKYVDHYHLVTGCSVRAGSISVTLRTLS
jgi:hypothetical protein